MSFRREVLADGVEVWNGDCLEILPTLTFDVCASDPPYGIGWKRGVNKSRASKRHAGIANDGDTSVRDAALAIVGRKPSAAFGSFYAKFPANIKQILVWHKPADSGLVGSVTGVRRDAEPIFLVGDWPVRTVEQSSVLRTIAGQAGTVTETGHPHTKPVDLMKQIIRLCPGGVIVDPFMGSGSTGVAAVQLGRKFIGIEIDPGYFATAYRRIEAALRQPDMFVKAPAPKPAEQLSILDGNAS